MKNPENIEEMVKMGGRAVALLNHTVDLGLPQILACNGEAAMRAHTEALLDTLTNMMTEGGLR